MKGILSNAKIYKIINDYNNDIYIGSTTRTLVKRFSQHKCDAIVGECGQVIKLNYYSNHIKTKKHLENL